MLKNEHGGNIYKFGERMYDFSANINPLGMPESAKRAIVENIDEYEAYPDPKNTELVGKISEYYDVDAKKIVCGNGAADIIFRLVFALSPKKALIISPTFSEYEKALSVCGCEVCHYILTEEKGFVLDEYALQSIDESYDIVFMCNPNNPTGIVVPKQLVRKICERCECINAYLVVDECFSDFVENEHEITVVEDITKNKNLIILKAFTKIYAMAGIRLGFAFCGDEILCEKISDIFQPWSVSTVATKAGIGALEKMNFVERTKEYVAIQRKYLLKNLTELGFKTYNSTANYIFFKTEIPIINELEKEKILVRSCVNYLSLNENYYRIAVRTAEENAYLIKTLTKIKENFNG